MLFNNINSHINLGHVGGTNNNNCTHTSLLVKGVRSSVSVCVCVFTLTPMVQKKRKEQGGGGAAAQ